MSKKSVVMTIEQWIIDAAKQAGSELGLSLSAYTSMVLAKALQDGATHRTGGADSGQTNL